MSASRWRTLLMGAIVLITCASCLGASCFGAATQQRRFYVLSLQPVAPVQGKQFPGVVRVRTLDAESAYDRFQIVVRRSPFELEYREADVWAVKPGRTIGDLLARGLVQSRLFRGVTRELSEQRPDYILGGDLYAIEIFDSGDEWFAHLSLNLNLSRFDTGERLWRYSYDERRPIATRNFSHASRVLSEMLSDAANQAVTLLQQHSDALIVDTPFDPEMHTAEPQVFPGRESPPSSEPQPIFVPEP